MTPNQIRAVDAILRAADDLRYAVEDKEAQSIYLVFEPEDGSIKLAKAYDNFTAVLDYAQERKLPFKIGSTTNTGEIQKDCITIVEFQLES